MCTLAIAWRVDRRWPIVVAANRDERIGRAAEGWSLREPAGAPRYAAPRDLVAGGTWIGVSARGLFAAVTNFHTGAPPDPRRRSRGDLVPLALAQPTAVAARAAIARQEAAAWNPFHLLVAGADGAFLWRFDGERAALEDLAPGLHVVTESAHDGRGPRGELVRARWPLDVDVGALREVLTVHASGRDEATCIHMDPLYGTRSSAVLRLAPALAVAELYAADGRPCLTPLEDRSRLLQELARSA
jgi:uncharacterized protein with NRDE domain